MKRLLLVILLIIATMTIDAQEIKAISFNIRLETTSDGNNQWDFRKESVFDFLQYENPDFVGMQEVLWSQLEDIENTLAEYKWIGVGRDDGKNSGEFSPIFYHAGKWELLESNTFWLSEDPEKPSKSWDAALPRICTWGRFKHKVSGKVVWVFNTHFDHVGKQARINSAKLIADRIGSIAAGKSSILLGDFNVQPDEPPIKTITDMDLIDSYTTAKVKFGSIGTFNGFNYADIPTRRIDYVFTTADLNIKSYSVASDIIDGRYLSDHFPVIVQMELK